MEPDEAVECEGDALEICWECVLCDSGVCESCKSGGRLPSDESLFASTCSLLGLDVGADSADALLSLEMGAPNIADPSGRVPRMPRLAEPEFAAELGAGLVLDPPSLLRHVRNAAPVRRRITKKSAGGSGPLQRKASFRRMQTLEPKDMQIPADCLPQGVRKGRYNYTIKSPFCTEGGVPCVVEVQLANKAFYVKKASPEFVASGASPTIKWSKFANVEEAWTLTKASIGWGSL